LLQTEYLTPLFAWDAGTSELKKFVHDPDCFCMILGRDGSEGLDLSFVTREFILIGLHFLSFNHIWSSDCLFVTDIFFLEEVWDKSLATQTIARAWRMGAKGPVEVETIIARDTVEESMKAYEEGKVTVLPKSKSDEDTTDRKIHVLLKSLKFLTDYHQFRKNERKRPPQNDGDPFVVPPTGKKRKVKFLV
jgi:hypothetical protein